ncbi:hypothetical protein [Acinetobacter seifertii]|uniref:hypothetical protein n=1 Tax=Acinetobacter seifertii TaxID=1530123 RepID=UPI003EDFFC74
MNYFTQVGQSVSGKLNNISIPAIPPQKAIPSEAFAAATLAYWFKVISDFAVAFHALAVKASVNPIPAPNSPRKTTFFIIKHNKYKLH